MLDFVFVRPDSDHQQPLLLTESVTDSRSVDLVNVTLAFEDAYSKLVDVVTVDDVDYEDHVDNSLLQIWELGFGHIALNFCSDFEHKAGQDFEVEVQARF